MSPVLVNKALLEHSSMLTYYTLVNPLMHYCLRVVHGCSCAPGKNSVVLAETAGPPDLLCLLSALLQEKIAEPLVNGWKKGMERELGGKRLEGGKEMR